MTSPSVETRLLSAIVHIHFAIVALVPINTNAGVTSLRIMTSGTVLAHIGPQSAFVHVLSAIAAGILGRTVT